MEEKVSILDKTLKRYQDAIKHRSSSELQAFLQDTIALEQLVDHQVAYCELRMARFDAYKLIGEFQQAQREYKAYIATYPDQKIIDWVYKLSDLYFTAFIYSDKSHSDQWIKAMESVVVTYKKRPEAESLDRYQRLALANIQSFAMIYRGDKEGAKALYSTFQFQPIEIAFCNDQDALPFLYGNYMKGLWSAILLKDRALLNNLLKVVSIDDQTLYGEKDLFTLFYKTVMDIADTKSAFKNEFNLFFIKKEWSETTKDIGYILDSIKGQLTSALKAFFSAF
ncbi:hypothetical protein K4L44_10120 [Halosquirtibacter laminarini]|uniref:Uncharacterized protein n=1 Tax=Halosquirtibacter laminarini TaxID=3374600 RepID=A0AC61NBW5_9BACT|nr:hypothetical protein K4L44_10120 [Prolixibacteraceae bacterium]